MKKNVEKREESRCSGQLVDKHLNLNECCLVTAIVASFLFARLCPFMNYLQALIDLHANMYKRFIWMHITIRTFTISKNHSFGI